MKPISKRNKLAINSQSKEIALIVFASEWHHIGITAFSCRKLSVAKQLWNAVVFMLCTNLRAWHLLSTSVVRWSLNSSQYDNHNTADGRDLSRMFFFAKLDWVQNLDNLCQIILPFFAWTSRRVIYMWHYAHVKLFAMDMNVRHGKTAIKDFANIWTENSKKLPISL